jgi:hypothetical protein
MVCLRNISVDTLHKEDNEDDDDDDDGNNNINNNNNNNSPSQSLKRLTLPQNTYIQMQKSVILDTCSIVRNFLNYE